MSQITFILGGARSGKSTHALQLAQASGRSVTFLATAQAFDAEMTTRIQKHQSERPADWLTLELPLEIAHQTHNLETEIVILDCITLLASNILMQHIDNDVVNEANYMTALQTEINELLGVMRQASQHWIIVSNEVGLGLVPPYPMGRVYRDGLGWANQTLAREANTVLLMVAGIPLKVKG